MTRKPRILAMAGSTRKESYNKKLLRIAAKAADESGAEVTIIDLRDLPMPLYDGDLEQAEGMPPNAATLKKLMREQDGFLLASAEYNSSFSAVLKNTIDWVSRPAPDEPGLIAFRGKAAALMSASPGGLGGLRGLVHLRSVLGNIGVILVPDQVSVPQAHEAFQEDGNLKDAKQQASIEGLGRTLTGFLKRFVT